MKVDLITLNAVKNYGSVLQAFATQEKFKDFGCEVTIINYIREDVRDENLLSTWCGNNLIKKAILYPTLLRWKKVFNSFLKKNLNLSIHVYTDSLDFEDYQSDADIYCTGSDQVWNSEWNKDVILPLYLSFIPGNKKKFAYAASFGREQLDDQEIKNTQKYINQYAIISVREDSGVSILKEQYHYNNCCRILDPTLVMTSDFWRKYETPKRYKFDYILIYQLNRNSEFDKFAVSFAKKNNLKLVRLCNRYDQIIKPGKSALIPDIFDFISLIDNAKYIITDSFHATAFAVNLNIEPICIYPKKYGGRIESFLTLMGMKDRHLKDFNDFDIVNRKVDFNRVNLILNNERSKANKFLENIFSEN